MSENLYMTLIAGFYSNIPFFLHQFEHPFFI
nr:MAG TPA: hypothetical protein [Caudoviricetes sp.]